MPSVCICLGVIGIERGVPFSLLVYLVVVFMLGYCCRLLEVVKWVSFGGCDLHTSIPVHDTINNMYFSFGPLPSYNMHVGFGGDPKMGSKKRQEVFRGAPLSLSQPGGVRAPYLGDALGIPGRAYIMREVLNLNRPCFLPYFLPSFLPRGMFFTNRVLPNPPPAPPGTRSSLSPATRCRRSSAGCWSSCSSSRCPVTEGGRS